MRLSSKRLALRQLELADAPFILQLLNSPGWLTYIGDRGVKNLSDAENYIQNLIHGYANQPLGLSLVSLIDTNQPIGICGFLKRDFLPAVDIGYALAPDYEGKGYATEMVLCMLNALMDQPYESPVFALVKPSNTKSIKLLTQLGFNQLKDTYEQKDTLVYRWDQLPDLNVDSIG